MTSSLTAPATRHAGPARDAQPAGNAQPAGDAQPAGGAQPPGPDPSGHASAPARSEPIAGRPGGRATAPAIDVRGLTKRYGRRTVVQELDITVPAGVVAGFVGPNGAGKTTTLRMLLGLVRPSAGDGTILGEPLRARERYLPRVGALIEGPALYPGLSGRRNLASLAVLAGQDPALADAILDQVGLTGRGDDLFRTYSLGMKQRLGIGAALLSDPDLLVLDEPTNGLDPAGIRQIRDLVRTLAEPSPGSRLGARTVLVSSHLLAEVEQICDWLIVLDQGRLAYQGPTDRFMAPTSHQVRLRPEQTPDLGMLADLVVGLGVPCERIGDALLVHLDRADAARPPGPPTRLSGAAPPGAARPGALPPGTTAAGPESTLAVINHSAQARGITLVEMTWLQTSLEDRYQDLLKTSRRAHPAPSSQAADVVHADAHLAGGER